MFWNEENVRHDFVEAFLSEYDTTCLHQDTTNVSRLLSKVEPVDDGGQQSQDQRHDPRFQGAEREEWEEK